MTEQMKMSEKERTFTLNQGGVFVLAGSRDTINLYLRMCLDKWEDIVLAYKRKAVLAIREGVEKGGILKEFDRDKTKAFNAWYTKLRGNDWRVEGEEDEVTKYQAADLFFLGVTPNV